MWKYQKYSDWKVCLYSCTQAVTLLSLTIPIAALEPTKSLILWTVWWFRIGWSGWCVNFITHNLHIMLMSRMHGDYFRAPRTPLRSAAQAPGNFIFTTRYVVCNAPSDCVWTISIRLPSWSKQLHHGSAVGHWPFTMQMPGFSPRLGHVWFVVNRKALGQI